jgi:hypothetical protein
VALAQAPEYCATGMSLTAVMERVHSDTASLPGGICSLLRRLAKDISLTVQLVNSVTPDSENSFNFAL